MTNFPEGQISVATANASVPREPGSNVAKSWFVPPIVVPAVPYVVDCCASGLHRFFLIKITWFPSLRRIPLRSMDNQNIDCRGAKSRREIRSAANMSGLLRDQVKRQPHDKAASFPNLDIATIHGPLQPIYNFAHGW
jgi:hypothetical protein